MPQPTREELNNTRPTARSQEVKRTTVTPTSAITHVLSACTCSLILHTQNEAHTTRGLRTRFDTVKAFVVGNTERVRGVVDRARSLYQRHENMIL